MAKNKALTLEEEMGGDNPNAKTNLLLKQRCRKALHEAISLCEHAIVLYEIH